MEQLGAFKSYTVTHYLLDGCFTSGCYYWFLPDTIDSFF